jgi:hypothetical protein
MEEPQAIRKLLEKALDMIDQGELKEALKCLREGFARLTAVVYGVGPWR